MEDKREAVFTMKGSGSSGQKSVLFAIRTVIIGTLSGAALSAVLLVICTYAFVSSENIPQDFLPAFIIAVSLLSSMFAGFISAKISRQYGLVYGSMTGLLLFLVFLLSGFAVAHGTSSGGGSFLRFVLMLLSGGIGGLISVNGKSGHK
jgi:putative membrane protein (TIGR04086 family)